MKNQTRIAIAGLLSAAGAVLSAFAAEFNTGGAAPGPEPAEPATPADPPKPVKPKKEKTTPPVVETPAEPVEEKPAEQPPTPKGDITNPDYERMRELINPIVTEGTGEQRAELRKIIAKYSSGGLKTMDPKHHAAFEKDFAALSY